MDYDKILAYLVGISTVISLLTGSVKNIHDIRKDKNKKKNKNKRRKPSKTKRRK